MKHKLLWVVSALPLVITALVVAKLPDSVPMHYDLAGNIDRWGSRYENFIFPGIILCMSLGWWLLLRHYEKKAACAPKEKDRAEAASNGKVLFWVAMGMAVLFGVMQCGYLYSSLIGSGEGAQSMAVDVGKLTNVGLGLFLIVLGNVMPKAKRNSMVGLRTVWSMENDRTWAASNRVGGKLMLGAGALTVVAGVCLSGLAGTAVMLVLLLSAAIASMAYSHRVWKKDRAERHPTQS